MNKGLLILSSFSLILLIACEDYYVPSIDDSDPILVVESQLTNINEPLKISLSRTVNYNERSGFIAEKKATVYLMSFSGDKYPTKEVSSGVYQTIDNVNPNVGESYYLQIKTAKGVEYRSETEELMPPTEIAFIQLEDTVAREIHTDYWGDPFVKSFEGIQISVLPETPKRSDVGFVYRWNALVNYYVLCGTPPLEYSFYCWKNMVPAQLYVYGFGIDNKNNKLFFDDLHFLSYYALSPQPIDSSRFVLKNNVTNTETILPVSKNYSTGFYYRIRQYTVTKKGADFWKQVKRQSEATGKLFDPVEEQLSTNIYCVTDSSIKALGFFNTASVTEKIIKVSISGGSLNEVFHFDYMPVSESGEDCYINNKPDFWF